VLVGHEPTMSAVLMTLIGAMSSEAIAFEPGTAALIDVASVARRSGRLVWFLSPAVFQ
jgi:phosphohistidine phosphatase SixA